MSRYAWPGNVRELRNAVERAIVLGDREQIVAARPAAAGARAGRAAAHANLAADPAARLVVDDRARAGGARAAPTSRSTRRPPRRRPRRRSRAARSLRELEREGILAALAATGGNKAQAAAILEIDRSTLYKKLKDYDIES